MCPFGLDKSHETGIYDCVCLEGGGGGSVNKDHSNCRLDLRFLADYSADVSIPQTTILDVPSVGCEWPVVKFLVRQTQGQLAALHCLFKTMCASLFFSLRKLAKSLEIRQFFGGKKALFWLEKNTVLIKLSPQARRLNHRLSRNIDPVTIPVCQNVDSCSTTGAMLDIACVLEAENNWSKFINFMSTCIGLQNNVCSSACTAAVMLCSRISFVVPAP